MYSESDIINNYVKVILHVSQLGMELGFILGGGGGGGVKKIYESKK